jgi:dihydropyrimidinase
VSQLRVTNARIVLPEIGVVRGTLVARDGIVQEVRAEETSSATGPDVIDARGRFVLPGAIDCPVHFGLIPPLADRLRSESAFAASGGITTVLRYFRRPESYLETLPAQIELAERNAYQDFGHHLALFTPEHVAEMGEYVAALGVTSFKLYLNLKGALGRDFFMDLLADGRDEPTNFDVDCTDGFLYTVLAAAARLPTRVRISVHSEDADIVQAETQRVRASGLDGLAAWHAARPGASEAIAISMVSYLARRFRVPVYFPHIGSAEAVEALEDARAKGTDYVAETCPQYVGLTVDDAVGNLAKVMPPVRTTEDAAAVWEAVRTGTISTFGSDHIVRMRADKNGTIWDAKAAFGGTGMIVPILLNDGLNAGRLTIRQVAQVASANAARAFGLYPTKGTLLPGSDADFMIVDPDAEWTVRASELPSASDFSIFEGRTLRGRVALTAVRGTVVYRDGEVVGPPNHGRYLSRGQQPEVPVPAGAR